MKLLISLAFIMAAEFAAREFHADAWGAVIIGWAACALAELSMRNGKHCSSSAGASTSDAS